MKVTSPDVEMIFISPTDRSTLTGVHEHGSPYISQAFPGTHEQNALDTRRVIAMLLDAQVAEP